MAERLFSTYQIASLLGATPGAVVEWIDKGWLSYRRMGENGSVRITESSLIEFLRDQGIDLGEILDTAVPADQRAEVYRQARARQTTSARPTVSTIEAAPAEPAGVDGQIVRAFGDSADPDDVAEAIDAAIAEAPQAVEPLGDTSDGPIGVATAWDARASQVCDAILADAVKRGAEAIHLTPQHNRLDLKLRIDGEFHDKPHFASRLPDGLRTGLLACLLARANPDIDPGAMTVPHKGEFTRNVDGHQITARFSALPTVHGPRLVIHLPPPAAELAELIGDDAVHARLAGLLEDGGLILVASRRRTRRDAVLRALLTVADTDGCSVLIVAQDTIFDSDQTARVRVDPACGLTWSTAMSAIQAQDADVLLLEELRDPSIAAGAFEAAHEGALVLAGIGAGCASAAIEELLAMGIEPWPLGTTLKAVIEHTSAEGPCSVVFVEGQLAEAIREGEPVEQTEEGTGDTE